MGQQFPAYYEDLLQLSDYLDEGIKLQWNHELRKQILMLLHKLKTVSRKFAHTELESELMAVEVTMGYGSGTSIEPNTVMVEEHQLRLLELAGLANEPTQSGMIEEELVEDEPVEDEPVEDEPVEDELVEDELVEDELVEDELVEDEPVEDEPVEDEPVEDDRIQLILCNCPGRDAARELAHGVITARLGACVNIIANIGSIYWWQGEIKDTAECQLQIKTASACVEDLIHYINQNHPNEVPEILVFPVDKGNENYFEWVKQETSEKQDV